MSKVVHLRISDEAVYTCLQVLKVNGVNTTNLPLATIVRRFIEGATDNYRIQKKLPLPEDLSFIVSALSNDEITPIVMEDVGFVEPLPDGLDQDKMDNIRKAMAASSLGNNSPEVVVRDVVEDEPVELPPPPWEAFHILRWATILDRAPKDVLVEEVVTNKSIPLQRAVQCIYSDLPIREWGTEYTANLVQKILPTINKYFEE
ncbi:MAG: hypothetical protein COA94_04905 [Rickettsiales bacterium]|nr:MAG: hypothetical protein COA94_04905 [Rickettsiales bacterium]